jgi:hypothetical protein
MSRLAFFLFLIFLPGGSLSGQSVGASTPAFSSAIYSGVAWNVPLFSGNKEKISHPMLAAHQQYFLWQGGWSIRLGKHLYQECRAVYGASKQWKADMGDRILDKRSGRYLLLASSRPAIRTLGGYTGISYAIPFRKQVLQVYGMLGAIFQPAPNVYAQVKTAGSNDLETWILIQDQSAFWPLRLSLAGGARWVLHIRGPLWWYAHAEANWVQRDARIVITRTLEQNGQTSAFTNEYHGGVLRFQPALGLCYVW